MSVMTDNRNASSRSTRRVALHAALCAVVLAQLTNSALAGPAGVLEPPLYDPKLDDAPNYGNTGATISFTGGLSLTTTTNPAFTATGGGTVTVSPCDIHTRDCSGTPRKSGQSAASTVSWAGPNSLCASGTSVPPSFFATSCMP